MISSAPVSTCQNERAQAVNTSEHMLSKLRRHAHVTVAPAVPFPHAADLIDAHTLVLAPLESLDHLARPGGAWTGNSLVAPRGNSLVAPSTDPAQTKLSRCSSLKLSRCSPLKMLWCLAQKSVVDALDLAQDVLLL